jgi:hypothetical protein
VGILKQRLDLLYGFGKGQTHGKHWMKVHLKLATFDEAVSFWHKQNPPLKETSYLNNLK